MESRRERPRICRQHLSRRAARTGLRTLTGRVLGGTGLCRKQSAIPLDLPGCPIAPANALLHPADSIAQREVGKHHVLGRVAAFPEEVALDSAQLFKIGEARRTLFRELGDGSVGPEMPKVAGLEQRRMLQLQIFERATEPLLQGLAARGHNRKEPLVRTSALNDLAALDPSVTFHPRQRRIDLPLMRVPE